MRILAALLLSSVLACSKPPAEPPATPRTTPVAPDAPLHVAKPDETRIQLDLAAARSAIAQKQQLEGKAPASLAELGVRLNFPEDLDYDPNSGKISSRSYPQH